MPRPKLAVIAGGVGAARLLRGVPADWAADTVAVVNVGDDDDIHGLRICPDLDTVMYTLADKINPETGWGLVDESWTAIEAVRSHAAANNREIGWFALGDRDLGTHLYRTHRLAEGAGLGEVTAELCRSFGVQIRIVPATENRLRTELETTDHGTLSFQEYFVHHHHSLTITSVRVEGGAAAELFPEARTALEQAEKIVIAPSNPVVSVGVVRAVPGVDDILTIRRDDVVAISPLVSGAAIKGPAADMMRDLGEAADVVGVARRYVDVAATMVIDNADAARRSEIEDLGMKVVVTDTMMVSDEASSRLLAAALAH